MKRIGTRRKEKNGTEEKWVEWKSMRKEYEKRSERKKVKGRG